MKKIAGTFVCLLLLAPFTKIFSQDNMEKLLQQQEQPPSDEKVFATFKTSKIISAQSTETVKKGTLDFRITHRFGNIGMESNGGAHTLWGFDDSQDIRFSFDYGLTNKMTIGVARSKMNELLDATFKWKLLEQTTNNKIPITICLYENTGFSPMRKSEFYEDVDSSVAHKTAHRFMYTSQLIIARKFNRRFSFEVLPALTHRNFVKAVTNPNNGKTDENDFFSLGAAFRLKLTKRFGIVFDYFHLFSQYRTGNTNNPFFDPFAIGVEIETGGHVFHINLTNAAGINENNFLPYTTDNWLEGGFKLGFNISRVFTIVKPNPPVQ